MNALGMPAVKGGKWRDGLKGLVIRIFVQDDLQTENWSRESQRRVLEGKEGCIEKEQGCSRKRTFLCDCQGRQGMGHDRRRRLEVPTRCRI